MFVPLVVPAQIGAAIDVHHRTVAMFQTVVETDVLATLGIRIRTPGLWLITGPLDGVLGAIYKSVNGVAFGLVILPVADKYTAVGALRSPVAMTFAVFPLAIVFRAIGVFHAPLTIDAVALNTLGVSSARQKQTQQERRRIFHIETSVSPDSDAAIC